MKLYVMRHGRTDNNERMYYNCRFDEDINETGVAQATAAAEEVASLPLDRIFCSTLLRARHTCALVNRNGVPVSYEPELMEREGGVLTNTPMADFDRGEYYNYYARELPEGLESMPELFHRVHGFLDRIRRECAGQSVLLVTHGSVARAIQYYFEPLPADGKILDRSGMKNCGIVCYRLDEPENLNKF